MKYEPVIVLTDDDIQKLSIRYFGDELTEKEYDDLVALCSPRDWSQVEVDPPDGLLSAIVLGVVKLIGRVRTPRRGEVDEDSEEQTTI